MMAMLCVGLGGFVGAVGRYLLGLVPLEGDFPLMTFLINFVGGRGYRGRVRGCYGVARHVRQCGPVLETGVCGGFTTFSTFSLETLTLIERGKYVTGAAYACGSVVACLAACSGALGRPRLRAAATGSAQA